MHQRKQRDRGGGAKTCLAGALLVATLFCNDVQAASRPSEDASFCRKQVEISTPGFGAELLASKASYEPGAQAVFRIDNKGSVPVSLVGESFALERFQDGRWVKDPSSPKVFTRIRLGSLRPGKSGFCRTFEIPVEQQEGVYRFRKSVGVDNKHGGRALSATFRVGAS
jgi:hypothetical protein